MAQKQKRTEDTVIKCPRCGEPMSFRIPTPADVTKKKPFWDGVKMCMSESCDSIVHYQSFTDGSVSIVYNPNIHAPKDQSTIDAIRKYKKEHLNA